MSAAIIGWLSSAVLIVTLGAQLVRQWRKESVEGVSPLLFAGQLTASAGLCAYSVLTRAWVFVVLNAAMALVAVAGGAMWLVLRRRASAASR